MSRRIKIFGYDTVSYFETRLESSLVATRWRSAVDDDRNRFGRKRWLIANVRRRSDTTIQLFWCDHAFLDGEGFDPVSQCS